jgi:spermidine synthase
VTAKRFEELDFRQTPIGEVSLRRRWHQVLAVDVFEVILGDEHLMSSVFTVAEIALARLGLAAAEGSALDVVVGGLGLGYTAAAALEDPRVASVQVVEFLEPVIDWHERGLVPLGAELAGNPRCSFVHGDFFSMALPAPVHAVLLDIDHSPQHVLHPSHAGLYTHQGLTALAATLHPGGVFALWSDDPPDEQFLDLLRAVFATAEGHLVPFANPLTGGTSSNGVYVARL